MTREEIIEFLKRQFQAIADTNLTEEDIAFEKGLIDQLEADAKRIAQLEKALEKSVADVRKMTHFINLENYRTFAAMEAVKEKAASLCESPGHPTYEALLIRQINCVDTLKEIQRKSSGVNDE